MNPLKQIEILFWVTIIEHCIMLALLIAVLIKKWYNKRSYTDRRISDLNEIIDDIRDVVTDLKPKEAQRLYRKR